MNVTKFVLGELENNTYVLENDGVCVVVDPATDSPELSEFLRGKRVEYILLTHGHFDHIAGVNSLVEKFGAKVCIHSEDKEMLFDGNKSFYVSHYGTPQPPINADILLSDGDELDLNGSKIKVMHTPGHTNGSVCYILKENGIIFSGDTLFRLSAGRTDLAGISPLAAGRNEINSLLRLSELEGDYRVLTGHGPETTLQFERENNRYMRNRNAFNGY